MDNSTQSGGAVTGALSSIIKNTLNFIKTRRTIRKEMKTIIAFFALLTLELDR